MGDLETTSQSQLGWNHPSLGPNNAPIPSSSDRDIRGPREVGLSGPTIPQPFCPPLGLSFPTCVMETKWGLQGKDWGRQEPDLGGRGLCLLLPGLARPHSCADLWRPGRPIFPRLKGVGPAGGPSIGVLTPGLVCPLPAHMTPLCVPSPLSSSLAGSGNSRTPGSLSALWEIRDVVYVVASI